MDSILMGLGNGESLLVASREETWQALKLVQELKAS